MGNAIGGGVGSAASGAIARGTGLIPRPEGPFDPAASADRELIRLDKLYPGTNPWERLGVNAGSPTEISAEQGRNQMRVANQQAKVALATNGQQIDAQQKIAAAQLSTQETLKRAELANSKDIATTQARANVINASDDPTQIPKKLNAVMTGNYDVDPNYTGRYGQTQRQIATQEGQLQVQIKQLDLAIQKAPLERKYLEVQSAASELQAKASMLSAQRSGGQWGTINQAQSAAIDGIVNELEKAPEHLRNSTEWISKQWNRIKSLVSGK